MRTQVWERALVPGSAWPDRRESEQMHETACDQLIFVSDAILRQPDKLVGERWASCFRGNGHSPRSIISGPCPIEGPREQVL
jgi:hypothetical protein